jgi:GAF domain-containing protein
VSEEGTRERRLIETFAQLADTLVDDYDILELLQQLVDTCSSLFEVEAAGLLLADPDTGELDLVASTSEASTIVETMQLGAVAGPCIEAFRTSKIVQVQDIEDAPDAWQDFRDTALEQGFRAVSAIPMRLRTVTIGALNLFATEPRHLNDRDLRAAQALADVATIGILHARTAEAADLLRDQLQTALSSRIVIEQAKGVLAHTHGIDMDAAFALLRNHARTNRRPLAEVAKALVDRRLIF